MTLDLEANEVEVKVLTSLASVAESTAWLNSLDHRFCSIMESESASEC
jgi:hypothetical protein